MKLPETGNINTLCRLEDKLKEVQVKRRQLDEKMNALCEKIVKVNEEILDRRHNLDYIFTLTD